MHRVVGLDIKSDGLASQRFSKDLHTAADAKHEVKGSFLLDVVDRKAAPIFKCPLKINRC